MEKFRILRKKSKYQELPIIEVISKCVFENFVDIYPPPETRHSRMSYSSDLVESNLIKRQILRYQGNCSNSAQLGTIPKAQNGTLKLRGDH